MLKLKNICLAFFTVLGISVLNAQNSSPEIIAIGDQNYCGTPTIPIATSISITDPDIADTTLNQVTVQISEGYVLAADQLTLTGSHPNITSTWNVNSGKLTLIGPATFTEFESALLSVVFSTTQVVYTSDRSFSINLGDANFLPATGHYYFYVANAGISWSGARTAAASSNYFGLQGYLATINSEEEAQLTGEQAEGTGWIGATDEVTDGVWRWVTGPEAGTQFWQGDFNGFPVNGEFSYWNFNEPNNFDGDEDYAHITDPSIGFTGSWNDLPNTGNPDPSNPYHPKGYIIEYGGMPGDPDINLSAATVIRMPILEVLDFEGCENDLFNLSLESNLDEVLWFDDPQLTNQVNSGTTFDITLGATITYYITGRFSNCNDVLNREFTVTVHPLPEAIDATIEQCDDDTNDGLSIFELNNYAGLISNGSSINNIVIYDDAALTHPLNMLYYENVSNGQVVYAQVINPNTSCYRVATVTLVVLPSTDQTYDLEVCDDSQQDGIAEFTLSDLNDEVLIGYPVTAQVSYFSSYENALIIDNPLPDNYTNSSPNMETIYAKVFDGLSCLSINPVFLTVRPPLELRPDESVFYCTNSFPDRITLDGGVVNGIPNNYLYNWSTGETTIQIQVNEPGNYFVDVTEIDGCTNRRTIIVLPSNIAEINLDIQDALDNNIVVVGAIGDGNYEFSLNSELGPYQDSNIFENVPGGMQTIYVRDKNGCGVSSETFPVISFPKFFTPNGDGRNDFWTIKAFDSEFLASSTVQIFNRQGKLLKVLTLNNPDWDGNYNGNPMPSDDYWFTVTFQDGRTFSKNFSLKR